MKLYGSIRATTDLDAVLCGASLDEMMSLVKLAMQTEHDDHVWFEFENESDLTHQSEYGGRRLQYRCGFEPKLKDLKRAQILHLDFGVGDPVTPAPVVVSMPAALGESDVRWQVYPLETICAEKLHTMLVRYVDNSRSKDVYDLSHLLPMARIGILKDAIAKTFEYRDALVPSSIAAEFKKIDTTVLRLGWKKATAAIGIATDFDDCLKQVVDFLASSSI